MPAAPDGFPDEDEGGIDVPASFPDPAGFERWLHDELCAKNDVISGQFLGIFSAGKKFLRLIRIPAQFRRNNLSGIVFPVPEHAFTDPEKALVRGNIVSHNHPADFPFLFGEILWAGELDVIESRIVTTDWVYSVRPAAAGWPSQETLGRVNTDIDLELSLHSRVARAHTDPEGLHRKYEQLAARAGFVYSREKYLPDKQGTR